jgi:beta-glucosidase
MLTFEGTKGSEAIANIIFGDYNPNGKLPITYPSSPNGFLTYDYKPMEVYDVNVVEWLYPFGHGLSYTNFAYSNLRLSKQEMNGADDKIQVSIDVRNTGSREGMQTVLMYIHDEFGTVSRPVKQLKGFNKQNYQAGELKTITFTLNIYDLSFINQHNHRVAEAGSFRVYVDDFNGFETFQLKSTIELDKSSKNSASGNSFFVNGFSFVLSLFISFYKLF